MKRCSLEDVNAVFTLPERQELLRKAGVMFKVDIDRVLGFMARFTDPTRGTIIRTNNKYIYVSVSNSNVVHVTDIVRYIIYNEKEPARIIEEKNVRLLARGLLYHVLFKKRFASRVNAAYEIPVSCLVDDIVLLGTLDVIVYADNGDICLIEVKSSSTETTINYGIVQTRIYWGMLKHYTDVDLTNSFVVTPHETVLIEKPLPKQDLFKLLRAWSRGNQ